MTTFSFFETQLQTGASKNFPTFMEWTKTQHGHSQEYTTTPKWTQSTSSHHTSLQSILIPYAHLCLGLSGLLPSGFLTEVCNISHFTVLDYLVTHINTHICNYSFLNPSIVFSVMSQHSPQHSPSLFTLHTLLSLEDIVRKWCRIVSHYWNKRET
jgi:hypothetical protein